MYLENIILRYMSTACIRLRGVNQLYNDYLSILLWVAINIIGGYVAQLANAQVW